MTSPFCLGLIMALLALFICAALTQPFSFSRIFEGLKEAPSARRNTPLPLCRHRLRLREQYHIITLYFFIDCFNYKAIQTVAARSGEHF